MHFLIADVMDTFVIECHLKVVSSLFCLQEVVLVFALYFIDITSMLVHAAANFQLT